MVIYKTTDLTNGMIYVGKDQKNNPEYFGSGLIIRKIIEKHGKENFIKEILEECTSKGQLCEREEYWIKELDATNRSIGYNILSSSFGGDTTSRHPNREEIIEKRRLKMIGHPVSAQARANISKALKGVKHHSDRKRNNTNPVTEKAKKNITIGMSKFKKPILQLDLEGNIVKEWESSKEILNELGYSRGTIAAHCRRESKGYGYKWKYK